MYKTLEGKKLLAKDTRRWKRNSITEALKVTVFEGEDCVQLVLRLSDKRSASQQGPFSIDLLSYLIEGFVTSTAHKI
jgi:hypothetical protein